MTTRWNWAHSLWLGVWLGFLTLALVAAGRGDLGPLAGALVLSMLVVPVLLAAARPYRRSIKEPSPRRSQ